MLISGVVLAVLLRAPLVGPPAPASPLPLVAIDPGHGGHLDGAIGVCGAKEKDVTLGIALELAALLENSGRATALLTRDSDRHVELDERAQIANRRGAVLLISVHANAARREVSHGVETYFLSRGGADRRVRQLVERENEGRAPAGLEHLTPLEAILLDLRLQAAHVESQRFARLLQEQVSAHVGARSRGVLQAPFMVLLGASMPSALVELGFLTNDAECRRLVDPQGRGAAARGLAAAILAHLAGEQALAAPLSRLD